MIRRQPDQPYDCEQIMLAGQPRMPFYPRTGPEFTARTGLTLDSLYLFNEASGTLDDKIGAADLPVVSAPTYAYSIGGGRAGVYYDAGTDANSADVNPVGTTSFLAWCVFRAIGNTSFTGIMGRTNATQAEQWLCWYLNTGVITTRIRDSGAGENVISTSAVPGYLTSPTLLVVQGDRAATTCRIRVSRPGMAAITASGSMAGLATLDGVAQAYGFGALSGTAPGAAVAAAGIRINADIEGAGIGAQLSKGLGWE